MARSVDVYADVLDDSGTWQRILIRLGSDAGHFQGVRDLDYIGKIEPLHGRLVGAGPGADRCHCQDAPLPQWLNRLKARLKGTT